VAEEGDGAASEPRSGRTGATHIVERKGGWRTRWITSDFSLVFHLSFFCHTTSGVRLRLDGIGATHP